MKQVYLIRNRINGKIYVGSSQCPTYRMKSHLIMLRAGQHTSKSLQADYDQYGDCFDLSILSGKYEDKAGHQLERELMIALHTFDAEYGYNDSDTSMNRVRRENGLSYRVHPAKGKKRRKASA